MIPYYSPNFTFSSFIRSLFVINAEERIVSYYKAYTKKKYVLLTGSCRSSLLLSYKAIGRTGEVITSPLTCKVAIDPIIQSENKVIYCDVSKESLVVDTNLLNDITNSNTIAIQAIHLGGDSVDTSIIREICDRNKLYMIEDCAQGFFSKSNGIVNGQLADVSCFSLIKNAYGLAGGILATDDKQLYERAKKIYYEDHYYNSLLLIAYRILRNILETSRTSFLGGFLYNKLIDLRPSHKEGNKDEEINYHLKLRNIEKKIAFFQLNKAEGLNRKRREVAKVFVEKLRALGIHVYSSKNFQDNSYTKLYVYHPSFDSARDVLRLNKMGVEAKHLEHKIGCYYQCPLTFDNLPNFNNIHDSVISLPLYENIKKKECEIIIANLKKIIQDEK